MDILKYIFITLVAGFMLIIPRQSMAETGCDRGEAEVCYTLDLCAQFFANDPSLEPKAPRAQRLAGIARMSNVQGIPELASQDPDETVAIGTFDATYVGLGPQEEVIDLTGTGLEDRLGPLLCVTDGSPAPSWCKEAVIDLNTHFHYIKDTFDFGDINGDGIEDGWKWQAPEITQVLSHNNAGITFPLAIVNKSGLFSSFLKGKFTNWVGFEGNDVTCDSNPATPEIEPGIVDLKIDFEIQTNDTLSDK